MRNSRVEIIGLPSPAALLDQSSSQWMEFCRRWDGRRPLTMALTGGRFARDFHTHLRNVIQRQAKENTSFSLPKIHWYWGDERCVGPEHAESNYRMARETLLEPLGISPEYIHRIQAELPVPEALARAQAEFETANVQGLDLVFLSMGEDGHIASIFPGATDRALQAESSYSHVVASKPPPDRITLNYGPLIRAGEVWCFAAGTAKASALKNSLAPNSKTPLGILLQQRIKTRIYTDIAL